MRAVISARSRTWSARIRILIEEYDAEHLPPPELQIDLEPREPSGWRLPGLRWLAGSGAKGTVTATA